MPVSDTFFPTLRYRDPAKAIEWLCDTLGFQRHFVAEDAGNIIHAQIRRGTSLIFLGPDHADDKYGMHSPLSLNGTNQGVYSSDSLFPTHHYLVALNVLSRRWTA